MISYFYGLSLQEIGQLTVYQFHSYVNSISKVVKIMNSMSPKEKPQETKQISTSALVEKAKYLGLKVPKRY